LGGLKLWIQKRTGKSPSSESHGGKTQKHLVFANEIKETAVEGEERCQKGDERGVRANFLKKKNRQRKKERGRGHSANATNFNKGCARLKAERASKIGGGPQALLNLPIINYRPAKASGPGIRPQG